MIYREKRLHQEKELLIKQQQFIQAELDKRTNEVFNIRQDMSKKLLELQNQVSEKNEEVFMVTLSLLRAKSWTVFLIRFAVLVKHSPS